MKSFLRFFKTNYVFSCLLTIILTCNVSNSQNWKSLSIGTNGTVYASLVIPGETNDLYIGGNFTEAGGISANYVARWDGQNWFPLGNGLDGAVYALAYFQGNVIAAGKFLNSNGIPVNRIAKWDGTTWAPLALGMNDDVYALAVYFNELRAGGKFTTAGGIKANRIASWNGVFWSQMDLGLNDNVYCLSIYVNDLIAGGRFTIAGGTAANRIAKWNIFWSNLGAGMDNGEVLALTASSEGKLYAGGSFTSIGGVGANFIAKWDGNNWSLLGNATNNSVYSLYQSAAIGKLIVGGLFTNAGGVSANKIATWDGTNWGTLGTGMSGADFPNVLCLTDYSALLTAGGNFGLAGSNNVNNAAMWGISTQIPIIISPACGSQGQSTTPLLIWTAVPNTAYYRLQLSTNQDFSTFVINTTVIQSQYQVPNGILNTNTTYYWRVNAYNGIGSSQFSTTCSFSTTLLGIVSKNIPIEFKLYQNYPNPFNPSTNIKFQIPKSNYIILKIYNISGKEIETLINEELKPGTYEIQWNASKEPSGIYFYRLTSIDFTQTYKMMVIR